MLVAQIYLSVSMTRSRSNHKLFLAVLALGLSGTAWSAPKFKVLHAFDPSNHDGAGLYGSLVLDAKGNLYGTTDGGGTYGYGTIFELMPHPDGYWTEVILHSFNGKDDGAFPQAGLLLGAVGNLYGMTTTSVFELKPSSGDWKLSVLYDSGGPTTLLLDRPGNLYAPVNIPRQSRGL